MGEVDRGKVLHVVQVRTAAPCVCPAEEPSYNKGIVWLSSIVVSFARPVFEVALFWMWV